MDAEGKAELRREFMAAARELEGPLYDAMKCLISARDRRVEAEEALALAQRTEADARRAYDDRALEAHRFVHEALDEIGRGNTERFLSKAPDTALREAEETMERLRGENERLERAARLKAPEGTLADMAKRLADLAATLDKTIKTWQDNIEWRDSQKEE